MIINTTKRLLLASVLFFLAACSYDSKPRDMVVMDGATMGTRYQLKLVAVPDTVNLTQLKQSIDQLLEDINQKMSTYRADSELSRFNQTPPKQWFDVSRDTLKVVMLAQEISELSDGAFDITVGPLVNIWGFGPDKNVTDIPSEQQINAIKQQIGYQNLKLRDNPPGLYKDIDLTIDLSAIAKGYAVDKLVELIENLGINNYLVEIGGELKAKGQNQRGSVWRIGVETPDGGIQDAVKSLSIDNIAVATSGDYRNYFEQDGKRYSHTIDPVTGYPITHALASVTVLAETTARADALATAFNVLGDEKAYELALKHTIAAFFIIKNTNAQSSGFIEKMTPQMQQYINH